MSSDEINQDEYAQDAQNKEKTLDVDQNIHIPSSAGYSMPNPGSRPWATGPGSFSRYQNCK